MTPDERFDAKVDRSSHDGCYPWTGAISSWGYGVFWDGTSYVGSHRYAFIRATGHRPVGDVDHLCHNLDPTCQGGRTCLHRRCVREDHLVGASRKENLSASNRGVAGRVGRQPLDPDWVTVRSQLEAFAEQGWSRPRIARALGLGRTATNRRLAALGIKTRGGSTRTETTG